MVPYFLLSAAISQIQYLPKISENLSILSHDNFLSIGKDRESGDDISQHNSSLPLQESVKQTQFYGDMDVVDPLDV